jgi:hypothetical protein
MKNQSATALHHIWHDPLAVKTRLKISVSHALPNRKLTTAKQRALPTGV